MDLQVHHLALSTRLFPVEECRIKLGWAYSIRLSKQFDSPKILMIA